MRGYISALSVSKSGNEAAECEDSYSVHPPVRPDELVESGPVALAVSDGASESLLARDWARMLTATVVASALACPATVSSRYRFADAVLGASEAWDAWLNGYLAERVERNKPVQWYERPGLARGAFATLVAAYFSETSTDSGEWYATALGDTCMFQVRDGALLKSFPLTCSSDFDSSPSLINSKNRDVGVVASHVEMADGDYVSGDQFFFGSDAIACWFLQMTEVGYRPWEFLRDWTSTGDVLEFGQWLDAERSSGRIRNDDVTLVHVDLG